MRGPCRSLLLVVLVATLAGCGGKPAARVVLDVEEPTAGQQAAFEAANEHGTAALLQVSGHERWAPRATGEDGEPLGFYAPLHAQADPRVGDGLALAWLWEFDVGDGGWEVITSGGRVVDDRRMPDDRFAEHTGQVPLDLEMAAERVILATADLADILGTRHPGWHELSQPDGAVSWQLANADGAPNPFWMVEGGADANGRATFGFKADTGDLDIDFFGDAAPVAPGVPSLVLSDCTNFGGVFPVDMAAARAALPAGFEPVPSPNDPAGGATLYILFLQCGGSMVDGNDTGPTVAAYAELAAVPPSEFELDGITDYTVPLAFGAGSDAVGQRLADFGLGIAGAATTTDVTDGQPGPQRLRLVVGDVTLDLTGQMSPQDGQALGDGGFALIGVQDGAVRTIVRGQSEGGTAVQGTVTHQSTGLPILEGARPIALGFSVTGFSLTFTLARTV